MWSDNEANIDLINVNDKVVAIEEIIANQDILPTTIGIFGDWGSGKSSLMRIVQNSVDEKEGVITISFNGWVFEDYEDAKGFLTEQFNIYLYNYLFDDDTTKFNEERVQQIQTIKAIANEVIEYIARFEDELKEIWNKPKFVRNSNYVFTLDRIADNVELIEKIIGHPDFDEQIEEYKHLHEEWTNEEGDTTKKVWKEFEWANDFKSDDIIISEEGEKKLNPEFKYIPIDTKYFGDLKWDVLDSFDHLEDQTDGYLIKSDNYQALNTLLPKYKESIDLVYIDPPFNTGDDFLYKDKFQDSSWLTLMENRIEQTYDLLTNSGSFYLHLDKNANYLGRELLNTIFGENSFRNEIFYKRSAGHALAKGLDVITDTIYWYSKSNNFIYNQQYEQLSEEELEEKFPHLEEETGRRFNHEKLEKSSNSYSKGESRIIQGREVKTDIGWIWTQDTFDERLEENEHLIYWTENDRPRYKNYADEYEGRMLSNLWNDLNLISSNSGESMKFETQKPESLMKRIIDQSTKNDACILDYFSGSGTTIATAHKLNDKWIGVELGKHFYDKNLPRMKKVLVGDASGISKEVGWEGGGFFKYYELEQYEEALARSAYQEQDDYDISKYTFGQGQKQLEAIELDYENEKADIHFEKLYPDVDIAETFSNLTGKKIRKLNAERVEFEDGQKIVFDEMIFGEYPWIKPLIWWNSRREKQN
jgi:adenine specific DNA methylase Mod